MKFILIVFFIIFMPAAAYASPSVEGTDVGEDAAAEKAGKELAESLRHECLNRRGGDTKKNRQKCEKEKVVYRNSFQTCLDKQREDGFMDLAQCRWISKIKSQGI